MNDFDRLASIYDLDMGTKEDDIPTYLRYAEELGAPILELGSGTGQHAVDDDGVGPCFGR